MKTVDRSVVAFFWRGVTVSLTRPAHALDFARTAAHQAVAARKRRAWRKRGIQVPPIVIFSVTHRCNLACAGCYAQSFLGLDSAEGCVAQTVPGTAEATAATTSDDGRATTGEAAELSDAKLRSIVAEAAELGVSFFVIAGGEPLMREELLSVAKQFPQIVFLVFTNGTLLDEQMVKRVGRLRNLVPLISLEGTPVQTDERRGEGTYEQLREAMDRLDRRGQFFGCSLTLTSRNFGDIFSDGYVDGLAEAGCRFFLFLDYTPVDPGTEGWVLTASQRDQVETRVEELRGRHRALFVAVPWDEEEVGGCLSAGRGFIHINASGEVEPCPFAPYSDADLNDVSLREALNSPFLARLRDLPELLEYEGGGCELWNNREEVERILEEVRAPSSRG